MTRPYLQTNAGPEREPEFVYVSAHRRLVSGFVSWKRNAPALALQGQQEEEQVRLELRLRPCDLT